MFISEQKATAVAETPRGTGLVPPRGLGLVSPQAGLVYRRAGSVVSSPVRPGLATAWPQGPSACSFPVLLVVATGSSRNL